MDVPQEEWGDGAKLDDPDGVLPDIGFLRVPEGKTAKNRLHLDLQVSGGRHLDQGLRRARIQAEVDSVVMADPEGNEFCVV